MQASSSMRVFGPAEITHLSTAYESALACITEDSPTRGLTGLQIRRQIAAGIIQAARQGQLDPERLRDAALQSLEARLAQRD